MRSLAWFKFFGVCGGGALMIKDINRIKVKCVEEIQHDE